MIVTKVYAPNGDLLREYPDAFADVGIQSSTIWESSLANDVAPKDSEGNRISKRVHGINTGNWLACISGPAIIIEERQDENSKGVGGGETDR